MNRRQFLLTIGAGATASSFPALSAGPARRTNVLFIAVDDLRPELGCYGNRHIKTPNMDRLATSGVTFTRAYCQQAVCNPSRASLMTGLRPDSTRVWDLVTHFRDTIPDVVTLPQHFKQHGYTALGMGKIYHGTLPDRASWSVPQPSPKRTSFYSPAARKRLAERRAAARQKGKSEQAIRGHFRGPATDAEDVPDDQRYDGALTELALEHLRRLSGRDEPFFLAVGYIWPHLPWTPPKRYWDLYDPATLPLASNDFVPRGSPPMAMNTMYELRAYMDFAGTPTPKQGSLTEAQRRRLKHGYYAAVSFVDVQIGRLLDELDRLKLRDDTIVVLWGDHGWKLGEHNSWCKQTNYETDTRAPLIIRVPGAKANGRSCGALVEFVDIYPTLCESAGLPLPAHLEGRSVARLLQDPALHFKDAAFSQFRRRHEGVDYMGYAMRTRRHRYVEWLNRANAETVAVELYDHERDPQENANIAGEPEHSPLVAALSKAMWKAIPRPKAMPARPRPRIRIENGLDEAVDVFWLAPDGRRVPQGRVEPGKTFSRNTTRSHTFLVVGTQTDYSRK
ncbi:sulfatase-like hydrolase/transferase, partial [bacterium]|nr:sulfatase-like hydrolase/transferase [bacterium]